MLNPIRRSRQEDAENLEPLPPVPVEKPRSSESLHSRWVNVRELPSGEFVGEFRLGCAGIIRARWDAELAAADQIPARQDRMLRSILSVLGQSDAVEFRFSGGGSEQLRWEICGQSRRETRIEAAAGATNLLPSFITLAAALGNQYRMEPIRSGNAKGPVRLAFRHKLRTDTMVVLLSEIQTPMGFREDNGIPADQRRVAIPIFQPKKSFAFASLAAVIAGAPVRLRCSVRLTPFTLGKPEAKLVKEAFDRVVTELAGDRRSSDQAPSIDESLAGCKEALAQWATSGAGYRLAGEVTAAEPISPALRDLVANELFPNNAAARRLPGGRPSVLPQDSLDLSDSIPTRGTLPILFPDLETLQRQDLRQIYNRKKPRLPKTGLRMGHIDEAGLKMRVNADRQYRDRHSYIIGATGTGKSTLLFNSIVQDINAGKGLCLIDPHGDLYQQVLRAVPASRQDDVILLNPCETDSVPGINFLEVSSEKTRTFEINYAINELVKMLDRIYDLREVGGPMFEMYFRNALVLLAESRVPGYTLAELPAIFEDSKFRDHLKENCENQYAVNFWKRQAEKAGGEASLQNMAPYITSKLNLLTQSALLRPIIGQSRSTIDFREVMDKRQILLVNLSKGQLGELDMQLLGMIIIGKIFSSAMSRCALRHNKRVPFHLYVDEFQNFTTDTAAALLSEARKFQLCLTLANQNLAQLNTNKGKQNLFDAILGNIGSFILFRLGAPDADKMQVYTNRTLTTRTSRICRTTMLWPACRLRKVRASHSFSGPKRQPGFRIMDASEKQFGNASGFIAHHAVWSKE
jgi:Type IV secretion-system coupling protein DNA-binding domain